MSRSYKRTPIFGNACCDSEKEDKQLWHRAFRRKTKLALKSGLYLPDFREVSNPWDFGKDGKHYWPEATKKDMIK